MIELYCFRCGKKIEYKGSGTLACPFCGYDKHISAIDEERAEMHAKAEFYLFDGQYFNALKMYEILLKADDKDAGALFGAVLSEYGAKFTDNYDGTYSFLCEKTQSLPVYESEHYKRLCDCADASLLEKYKRVIEDIAIEQEKNNRQYLDTAPIEEDRDYRAEAKAADESLADDYISARDKYLEAERKEKEAAEARRLEAKERAEAAQKARERRASLEAEKEKKKKTVIRISCVAATVLLLCVLAFTFVIPQIRYSSAVSDIDAGSYDKAAMTLRSLGNFKDSRALAEKYKLYGLEVSDSVYFGRYEQDGNTANGAEGIEWIVIGTDEGTVTLMSKHVLDCISYDVKTKPSYWSSCTLRKWLNEEFLTAAFTDKEANMLFERTNKNPDNDAHKTKGGDDTSDKVWILSLDEVNALDKEMLTASPTTYALNRGVYQKDGFEGTYWWLRSPGATQNQAAMVNHESSIIARGSSVDYSSYGVRVCITVSKGIID